MPVKPIPEGFHTVTPYLVVDGAAKLIDFLQKAFNGKVTERMNRPDNKVAHAEVKIGDSFVMLGEANEQATARPAYFYIYVPDVDAAYKQALAAGGTSIAEPKNQFYGDRQGGVTDPCGNGWWIATHIEDVPPEEMQKRAAAAMK